MKMIRKTILLIWVIFNLIWLALIGTGIMAFVPYEHLSKIPWWGYVLAFVYTCFAVANFRNVIEKPINNIFEVWKQEN